MVAGYGRCMMTTNKTISKRVKAGTSKASAADRRVLFVGAYLTNGLNGTQAAIAAGYSVKTAHVTASKMLTEPKVLAEISRIRTKLAASTGLNTEVIIREIGRLCLSDVRKLVNKFGQTKHLHELDDDTAAALDSIKIKRDGTVEYRFCDKGSALEKAARILGLYEVDNKQTRPIGEFRLIPLTDS